VSGGEKSASHVSRAPRAEKVRVGPKNAPKAFLQGHLNHLFSGPLFGTESPDVLYKLVHGGDVTTSVLDGLLYAGCWSGPNREHDYESVLALMRISTRLGSDMIDGQVR
jgi:hypothetical protein